MVLRRKLLKVFFISKTDAGSIGKIKFPPLCNKSDTTAVALSVTDLLVQTIINVI